MAQLPFIGPTYQDQSVTADAELCLNWYVELLEGSTAQTKAILLPRPGVASFCTLPTFPVRGEFSMAGRSFFVGGDVLYEITLDPPSTWPDANTPRGTAVARGTMATGPFPATISSNGDGGGQLFVTSGGKGYIYDLAANTLTFVVEGADLGAFLEGYFIRLDVASSTFAISALEDGLTWDSTMFAQRSLAADPWVSMAISHGELWLFGEQTSEVWQNTGAVNFPFVPIPGATLEQGCAAAFSVSRLGSSLMWLAQNDQGQFTVCRSNGYQATRVSNHAMEAAIQAYRDLDDADAYSYQEHGHEFYILNLPSADLTWAYDATTNMWARRDYWNPVTARSEVARPRVHSVAFGLALVGDRVTGDILRQDVRLTTDTGGVPIRRVRRATTLTDQRKWARYRSAELTLDVGLGVERPSRYYDVILASSPTHYFRLGETERLDSANYRFADSVMGGGASMLAGPTGAAPAAVGVASLVGDANKSVTWAFNGAGLAFGSFSGMTTSGTTFSLELSMRPASGAVLVGLFTGTSPVAPFHSTGLIYNPATGRLGYDRDDGTSNAFWSTVLEADTVYHVVLSVTAGVGTLYVNGELDATTVTGIPAIAPVKLASGNVAVTYGGGLDEIVYYAARALTASEADAHYVATGVVSGEPQVMLRWSDDNARTWSPEHWRSAGAEGRYATRLKWYQLGRARTRIFEVAATDGTPWRLVDFYGDLVPGTGA